MSTKAIREALEAYRKTATPLDERYLKIMRALDEVEAIERAAQIVARWGIGDVVGAEVWQSAYGHQARKRTWLYACGQRPPDLDWTRKPGAAQVGWFDRRKPSLSKREAKATPAAFRDALLVIARSAA